MFKRNISIFFLATGIILLSVFSGFSRTLLAEQGLPFMKVEEKLAGLAEEEKETLHILFSLLQEIENMVREQKELAVDIAVIVEEINLLENRITIEENLFEDKLSGLRQILRSYQRMGASTYLEIILDSDSLRTFLRRLNTFRDLTRNTGELLISIEESRDRLAEERERHDEKLLQLTVRQKQLEESLGQTLQLKKTLEEHLLSLEEERGYYQEQLDNMQLAWADLRPFITETIKEFSLFIKERKIPSDAMETNITFMGIRASLDEQKFNEIVGSFPRMPEMTFSFSPGKVQLDIPEKYLMLIGSFVIIEKSTIEFRVTDGTFYGIHLGERALEELFQETPFILDFEALIGDNTLYSIETKEEKLQLFLVPDFLSN